MVAERESNDFLYQKKLKIEKLLFLVVAAVEALAAVAAAVVVVGATVVAAVVPAVVRKILITFHGRRSGFP